MLVSRDMGRPKTYKHPPNMTFDVTANRFVVRNPATGKKKKFEDEDTARKAAEALAIWLEIERQRKTLEQGRPTIGGLVQKWQDDRLPFQPWSEGTRRNYLAKMNRISRELGNRTIMHTDCMFLEDWICNAVKARTADTFNDWRYVLDLLWKFAVSRKLAQTNEAAKIEERSTSKKIEANRKVRQQLDLAGFRAIHDKAPAWLQLAMEQSLVTLQARNEICNMQHAHFRDGFLYVIRDKVSGDSDMAFIRIKITEQLEELRKRSVRMYSPTDDPQVVSFERPPFLVFRKPDRRRREWTEGKPHWTYVNPDYLSKAFAEARDQVERFAAMPERQRPTFHEIRGLGARTYEEQGMGKAAIQALMTHAHKRTTQIYLERGAKALTDADYHSVVAPLVLREVLK